MKFDVIIGNPPYQGTAGTQTGQTIWDKVVALADQSRSTVAFVDRFLITIIPTTTFYQSLKPIL